jgi:hypothetical protein
MAALEAAGFDPTPGKEPSLFRKQLREDQANLNPDLRRKMRDFFDRGNRSRKRITPAEQSSPYISMVYSLTAVPELADPPRIDDLPGELLDVLDFAPLLREFYKKSGIEEKLPDYVRSYQAVGNEMKPSAEEMVLQLTAYLHTQPEVDYTQKVKTEQKAKGKGTLQKVESKFHRRTFYIVPDLVAVPGTVNFRNIGDDYFAIVPPGTNLAVSEVRRAYLQFIFDPLVLRNAKEIAAKRDGIKKLIDERTQKGGTVSQDVFLTVTRSLIAAADARQEEFDRIVGATYLARQQLAQTNDQNAKLKITQELDKFKRETSDETIARLYEAYENGAVLSFYFAERLKGMEESGFDVSGTLTDMIFSMEPEKEGDRLTQNLEVRNKALAVRKERQIYVAEQNQAQASRTDNVRERSLVAKLTEVEDMITQKSFDKAEDRLTAMLQDFPGEPRIFYARGRVASLSALDAINDDVRNERLNRAAAHYRSTILHTQSDGGDKALLSLAHVRLGKILEFNDQIEAAKAEYDAAIKLGAVKGGALKEAEEYKQKLEKPQQ